MNCFISLNNSSADYFQTPAYTHYDIPTADATSVTGYIINTTDTHDHSTGSTNENGGACLDCHNPHNPDLTINDEWAQSPHSGDILQAKLNAYNTAKANGDSLGAISSAVHTAATSVGPFNGEQMNGGEVCWRCHTSTGFRDLANATMSNGTYAPNKSEFTAMVGPDGKFEQIELVYCWACHTTDVGDLRNPGAFNSATMTDSNGNSTYVVPSGSSFPSKGDTNYAADSYVCINCHSGRETGQYVQQDFTVATMQGVAVGYAGGAPSVDSHHAQDAGILYRTIGYEYPGADYSNKSNFKHDLIGTTAAIAQQRGVNFTDNTANHNQIGPCVSCHMYQGASGLPSHFFNATTFDGNVTFPATANGKAVTVGIVSGIITFNDVCYKCHGTSLSEGDAETARVDALNSLEAGYQAALSALQQLLYNKYGTTSPTNWQSMGDVGAAFNLKTLQNMTWSFPHNKPYVKRLIFDSIDWLEHGQLTGTIDLSDTAIPGLSAAWPTPSNSGITGSYSEAQWAADWFINDDGNLGTANAQAINSVPRSGI